MCFRSVVITIDTMTTTLRPILKPNKRITIGIVGRSGFKKNLSLRHPRFRPIDAINFLFLVFRIPGKWRARAQRGTKNTEK